jgi:hypothetical protein
MFKRLSRRRPKPRRTYPEEPEPMPRMRWY